MSRPAPQLSPGQQLPERKFGPVTQTDVVRFAGAGGDFNPLHHDPAFAATAGLGGVIAMGQFQAGLLAGWLTDLIGVEHLQRYAVRFVAPVRLGDRLEMGGTVTGLDSGSAELELWVRNQDGPVVTGTARCSHT